MTILFLTTERDAIQLIPYIYLNKVYIIVLTKMRGYFAIQK